MNRSREINEACKLFTPIPNILNNNATKENYHFRQEKKNIYLSLKHFHATFNIEGRLTTSDFFSLFRFKYMRRFNPK
jgi:hypothetical protein